MRFTTTYWYDDVDFDGLEQRYGARMLRVVEFHLLAFEANKAASLAPTAIDLGPYADLVTEAFGKLWSTIFHHVWGVWRYENGLPEYRLPRPCCCMRPAAATYPSRRQSTRSRWATGPDRPPLVLCGGGKDSLVSMRLLQRAGIPYDTFVYSHSVYGSAPCPAPAPIATSSWSGACHSTAIVGGSSMTRYRTCRSSAVYPELGI